jgi:hypothetical protein
VQRCCLTKPMKTTRSQTCFCSGALFRPSSNARSCRPQLHGHLHCPPPPPRSLFSAASASTNRTGVTTCGPDHRRVNHDGR